VVGLDLPGPLEQDGIAAEQFRMGRESLCGGDGDLLPCRLGEPGVDARHHPHVGGGVERHDPSDEEHARTDSGEPFPAHVGVDAVDEVVDEVVQQDGIPVEPADLETSFDDVVPAEQHLPLVVGQRRPPLSDEPFEHRAAVGQATLQHEVVHREDRGALVEKAVVVSGFEQHPVQPPREARPLRERHEFSLEFRGTLEQVLDRHIVDGRDLRGHVGEPYRRLSKKARRPYGVLRGRSSGGRGTGEPACVDRSASDGERTSVAPAGADYEAGCATRSGTNRFLRRTTRPGRPPVDTGSEGRVLRSIVRRPSRHLCHAVGEHPSW
jgi:hypothetical protein